jgi:hypothetical protein
MARTFAVVFCLLAAPSTAAAQAAVTPDAEVPPAAPPSHPLGRRVPRLRGGFGFALTGSINGHADATGGFGVNGHLGVQITEAFAVYAMTRTSVVLTNEPAFVVPWSSATLEADAIVEWAIVPAVQIGVGVGGLLVDNGLPNGMPRALLLPLHFGFGPDRPPASTQSHRGWQFTVDVAPGVTEPYSRRSNTLCFTPCAESSPPVLPATMMISVSLGVLSYVWM